MKKLVKKIKIRFLSLNMSKKMVVIFSMLVLVTFNVVHYFYVNIYQKDMERNTIESFEQTVYLYEERLGNLLESTEAIVKAPFYFQQMQQELVTGESLSSESLRNIYYSVVAANLSNSNKFVVMLYDAVGNLVFVNASLENYYISQMNPSDWIKSAGETNGLTVFLPIQDKNAKFSFIVAKNIISIENFTKIGFMAVTIPKTELIQIYDSILGNGSVRVMIYNEFDEILFASADGVTLPDEVKKKIEQESEKNYKEFRIDTEQYLGYYVIQSKNKYKILIFTEKDVLFEELEDTQLIMRIVEIMAIVVVVLSTIGLSNFITKPLQKITQLMRLVENGDWTIRFNALYTDEIGVMGKSFNQMLDKMDEMLKHIVDISNAKKQTEIDALKGQINPHFMYNTLETFRMIAIEKEDDELADLLWRFGKMLRYNITTMNELATIQSEMEYMQYYIDIQNSRYQRKIQLICEVQDELKEYKIIKLLIQPIVENAVFHGLNMNVKLIGYVKVKIYRNKDRCIIEISDNGVGISEETLCDIRENLKLKYSDIKTSKYIGLRNVNERIVLYYGEDYGIKIDNCSEGGVLVSIILPYLFNHEI